MNTSLVNISKAKNALALARTLDDVLEIRDKAEAIRVYVKAAGESLLTQNAAAEIKLRAERKAGEILAKMEKNEGGRPATKTGNTMLPVLEDIGISKIQSSRWQKEASVPDDVFAKHVAKCAEEHIELTQASVLSLANAGHVSQATGENEWYTPENFIEIAREVLGEIDLDPASSDHAQAVVKAKKHYTIADDGLSKKWKGRVWMNPPYARDLVHGFAQKFVEHFRAGDISAGIVLVNNATETEWFQELAGAATSMCFPAGRIKFRDRHGNAANSPLQGQTFAYFGPQHRKFLEAFSAVGVCLNRANS